MTRYEQGFMNKCAEYGVDVGTAMGLMKQAIVMGGPRPPAGMLGASSGTGDKPGAKGGLMKTLIGIHDAMPSIYVKPGPFGLMPVSNGEMKRRRLLKKAQLENKSSAEGGSDSGTLGLSDVGSDKYRKRRKRLAIILSALGGGVMGAAAGTDPWTGKTDLTKAVIGALMGGGGAYGLTSLREYAGLDPVLPTLYAKTVKE